MEQETFLPSLDNFGVDVELSEERFDFLVKFKPNHFLLSVVQICHFSDPSRFEDGADPGSDPGSARAASQTLITAADLGPCRLIRKY